MTTKATILSGGDSGSVVVAGKPSDSYLLQRVIDGEMPPEEKGLGRKLPADEIATLEQWIADGANWPDAVVLSRFAMTSDVRAGLDWWSLQPVRRPRVPEPHTDKETIHPIDAFVLAKLERHQMVMAPPADRRQLIRRAYFDLLGLPPTPAQIETFVADTSADSYERLINELLESPHYGERWARYWLDAVRFAESCGYERDQTKPNIWKYRDWVVSALNADMPYDRFVVDQLAGDEDPWSNEQSVIATGMLRGGTWNDEPNDPEDYLYELLEDMVHVTSSAFLGLTVKCARCHDHKFDPIRQTDYYRLASYFWAGYLGQNNLGGPSAKQLGLENIFGWTDKGPQPNPFHLLIKGERHRPGEIVEPGFLSAIPELDRAFDSPPEDSKTSHRRLQFAQRITDQRNPLTARVFVNRLWLHHFGEGIVRTPNNFGFKSDPPTHPDLLDWLAAEFLDGDWKIKRMHKLIMMSQTYQQASLHPQQESYAEMDFENRRLWRQHRRRLDAEALRDAILLVSGQLNTEIGGESFYPRMSPDALEGLSRKGNAWGRSSRAQRRRRSIYMMTRRSRLLPFMKTFNFCDTTLPCGQRDVTTVAPQALALMNNHFVHEQSLAFAERVVGDAGSNQSAQVTRAWKLALGRAPSKAELTEAIAYLTQQRSHFDTHQTALDIATTDAELDVMSGLRFWLRADQGISTDENGGVMFWRDLAQSEPTAPLVAVQENPNHRPRLKTRDQFGSQQAVHFDGDGKFLQLTGHLKEANTDERITIIAVVTDESQDDGHREIISNWRSKESTKTSLFLGTTWQGKVRFTDNFPDAGMLRNPNQPSILTAINSRSGATVYQNQRMLAQRNTLSERDFSDPYVIGTQGNYGHEYWQGDIAEILIFTRALDEDECDQVWNYLARRYGIEIELPIEAEQLALATLCQVLLNTNEFIYVD